MHSKFCCFSAVGFTSKGCSVVFGLHYFLNCWVAVQNFAQLSSIVYIRKNFNFLGPQKGKELLGGESFCRGAWFVLPWFLALNKWSCETNVLYQ